MRNVGLLSCLLVESLASLAIADELPIKEVTVFKDGHALVLREGTVPVDEQGDVVLEELPNPVLGTFWPYLADDRARLASVVAGIRTTSTSRDAANIAEIVEANLGRRMRLTGGGIGDLTGVATSLIGPAEQRLLTIVNPAGMQIVPLANVYQIVLLDEQEVASTVERDEERPYLKLDIEWDEAPSAGADVGFMYLQKGLRWIPSYRITLDGAGRATVELQATLVNELGDLEDVTTNLVVGVPTFAFADTLDPMAIQRRIAPLGQYFEVDSRSAGAFSNAIMAQARMGESRAERQDAGFDAGPSGPELTGGERAEDLYVFTISGVTLAKGERMVVPVTSFELAYEDVFKLDMPIEPPSFLWQNFNTNQQRDIARLLERANVRHAVRLVNTSDVPITTAPAMIMRGERVISQGMITYAAPGAKVDLELTDAVDIVVDSAERETDRQMNSTTFSGDKFHLVSMEGELSLTSHRDRKVRVEVTRFILGTLDDVTEGVEHEGVSIFSSKAFAQAPENAAWWSWYNWPWWWMRVNGPQQLFWTAEIEPGETAAIDWTWHYYWR
jgi:hypothetical protein